MKCKKIWTKQLQIQSHYSALLTKQTGHVQLIKMVNGLDGVAQNLEQQSRSWLPTSSKLRFECNIERLSKLSSWEFNARETFNGWRETNLLYWAVV